MEVVFSKKRSRSNGLMFFKTFCRTQVEKHYKEFELFCVGDEILRLVLAIGALIHFYSSLAQSYQNDYLQLWRGNCFKVWRSLKANLNLEID